VFIIGITGGTGAGKTSALRAIKSLGALTLDCDEIYHELLLNNAELKSELSTRFPGVLCNGSINRKRLSEVVFIDRAALIDLNAITHKYVNQEVELRISDWEEKGGKIAAIDAIALIESGISEKCDITIGVTAPTETRISRIMARDGISYAQAEMRVNAQKPASYYIDNCDAVIENTYDTPEEFELKCGDYFKSVL